MSAAPGRTLTSDEDFRALHELRNVFIRYVEALPSEEIPDPDIVLKCSSTIQPYFANMHKAAKENLSRLNKEPDIVQLGFEMFEDTLLAYAAISVKYAEEIKRLKAEKAFIVEKPNRKISNNGRRSKKERNALSAEYYMTCGI